MTELDLALQRLAGTEQLLVALDFDGTLAPLGDDPAQSRALPRAREAVLALLDAPNTRVALISGRALASLREVTELPDTVLFSGSHGIEVVLDGKAELTITEDESRRAEAVRTALESVASRYDGCWVEAKPAGFALHTRLSSETDAVAATQAATQAVADIPNLTVRRGSDVLEFAVRPTNKGDALNMLREHSDASAVFFAGDDVTDEDAFVTLKQGDLGLKCGAGATAAEFSVTDPSAVAEVLHHLVLLRHITSAG